MAKSARSKKAKALGKGGRTTSHKSTILIPEKTITLVEKDSSGNILAKDAIQIARAHLIELLKLTEEPQIEEVEFTKDKHWYITFSLSDTTKANIHLLPILPRRFRVVKLDSTNGKLISISIRNVNG